MESTYEQEVKKFGKKDGIAAICVWLCYIILTTAYAVVTNMMSISGNIRGVVGIILSILLAIGVLILVKKSKQNLASVGLHKENLGKAIGLGLLFCLIPITVIAIIPGVLYGFNEVDASGLLLVLITTFFFAAHEDVIFIGFIQTRLYGLFKTHKAAIFVGAILFALMHVPLWIINGRLDFSQPLNIAMVFSAWISMHIIMVSIFKRYFSILPVFIFHTIWNYSFNFARLGTIDFSLIAVAIALIAACLLYWRSYKLAKKQGETEQKEQGDGFSD